MATERKLIKARAAKEEFIGKTINKRPPVEFKCPRCGMIDMAPPGTIAIIGCDGCGGWVEK